MTFYLYKDLICLFPAVYLQLFLWLVNRHKISVFRFHSCTLAVQYSVKQQMHVELCGQQAEGST